MEGEYGPVVIPIARAPPRRRVASPPRLNISPFAEPSAAVASRPRPVRPTLRLSSLSSSRLSSTLQLPAGRDADKRPTSASYLEIPNRLCARTLPVGPNVPSDGTMQLRGSDAKLSVPEWDDSRRISQERRGRWRAFVENHRRRGFQGGRSGGLGGGFSFSFGAMTKRHVPASMRDVQPIHQPLSTSELLPLSLPGSSLRPQTASTGRVSDPLLLVQRSRPMQPSPTSPAALSPPPSESAASAIPPVFLTTMNIYRPGTDAAVVSSPFRAPPRHASAVAAGAEQRRRALLVNVSSSGPSSQVSSLSRHTLHHQSPTPSCSPLGSLTRTADAGVVASASPDTPNGGLPSLPSLPPSPAPLRSHRTGGPLSRPHSADVTRRTDAAAVGIYNLAASGRALVGSPKKLVPRPTIRPSSLSSSSLLPPLPRAPSVSLPRPSSAPLYRLAPSSASDDDLAEWLPVSPLAVAAVHAAGSPSQLERQVRGTSRGFDARRLKFIDNYSRISRSMAQLHAALTLSVRSSHPQDPLRHPPLPPPISFSHPGPRPNPRSGQGHVR